jgi:putative membrane protein (TIGR04086 family)
VAAGAVAALTGSSIVLVAVLIIEATFTISNDSNLFFPLYLLVLLSMAYGGYVAGRSAPETPMLHGALAPVPAFIAILIVGVAIKLAKGTSWDVTNIVVVEIFNLFMSMTAGLLGGRLAQRRLTRR